jgi:hypothetical protein
MYGILEIHGLNIGQQMFCGSPQSTQVTAALCLRCLLQMLQFNDGSVLKELLTLLVTPPNIPHMYQNTCSRMLEDFHEFGSSGCSNLPEAKVTQEPGDSSCTGRLAQSAIQLITCFSAEQLANLSSKVHMGISVNLNKENIYFIQKCVDIIYELTSFQISHTLCNSLLVQ